MKLAIKRRLLRTLLKGLFVTVVCLSVLMLMLNFKLVPNLNLAELVESHTSGQNLSQFTLSEMIESVGDFVTSPVTAKDAINVTMYPFLIEEKDICRIHRPDVFVLMYVHTSPNHFKHRAVIRRTWGDSKLYEKLGTVTVFFVGRASDVEVADALRLESNRYGDIIQADFVDSYKNLSLKAVVALQWIAKNCNKPLYILKVDDDIFVNVFNFVRHLHYLHKYEREQNKISCLVWSRMPVLRDPKSKWYVSKSEFREDRYPVYCSGSAFFMPTVVTGMLLNASHIAPFFWVDDVYATGILAKVAGVTHISISSIVTLKASTYEKELIQGEAVFAHMTGEAGVDLRYQYWKKVLLKEEEYVLS